MTELSGTPRKPRTVNWTATEVEVLIEGVQEQYKLLFGHFSSTITQSQKKKVWRDIVQKINANSRTLRDIPQAKKKWADLKSLTRKKASLQKKERTKTGGGVADDSIDLSSIENKIISIIPACQVDGVKGGLESEACEVPGPNINHAPTTDEMAMVVSCPPPSPVAGPSTAADSDTVTPSHTPCSAEVSLITHRERKRVVKSNINTRSNDISLDILEVEKEKLNIQREQLATEKERLWVEKERLALEREILNCLKQKNVADDSYDSDLCLSPVIKLLAHQA